MKQIYLRKTENGELYPLHIGHYECPSLNTYGPFVRDYYIVHCVIRGKGVLINATGTHPVSKGEMFLIREGEPATYIADKDEPWEYVWIGFSGERSSLFDSLPDVMNIPADLDVRLLEYVKRDTRSTDIYTAILYEMMYHLFDSDENGEELDRIRDVHRYLKYNYMENITIAGLAARFGFERSYLYRVFKQRYGVGPKEYLTRVRLDKAKWLLSRGYSVAECAYMVGYSDAFIFSKAYKKHYGVAPSLDESTRPT